MIAEINNWPEAFVLAVSIVSTVGIVAWFIHCMSRHGDPMDYPRRIPDHDKPEIDIKSQHAWTGSQNTWTTTTTEIDRDEIKRILRELHLERELELAKAAAEKNPINQVLKQTAKEMREKE